MVTRQWSKRFEPRRFGAEPLLTAMSPGEAGSPIFPMGRIPYDPRDGHRQHLALLRAAADPTVITKDFATIFAGSVMRDGCTRSCRAQGSSRCLLQVLHVGGTPFIQNHYVNQ